MNRNDDDRSNPIKRAFSKFLERGDVSKPKDPARASPTVQRGETRAAPRVQAARTAAAPGAGTRAAGATATPASRSAASGTLVGGATRSPTGGSTTASAGAARPTAAGTGVPGATSASAPQTRRTYTVQKGDSLSKIAQQTYGRADRWRAIFDANRDQIDDPDLIHPGQVLVLPDLPKLH